MTGPVPPLVAHRGYAGRYPENTLLAVETAPFGSDQTGTDLDDDAPRVLHHGLHQFTLRRSLSTASFALRTLMPSGQK